MVNGAQIVNDFVSALRKMPKVKTVMPCQISRNVFEVDGPVNCLIYVKGRGGEPYRWGVTANVVRRLQHQNKNWFVVLVYESHNTGYLLSSDDVLHYIHNIWPLGSDGDYKPAAPGTYLSYNTPFKTFDEFFRLLHV